MLGLQLCLMETSYFQRHTPTNQIENSKYDCLRLHRIWVPNTMEPKGKKNIGFEIIVFGQIIPHKIGVLDLRSPNSQIQFPYTPNTTPIKDGLNKWRTINLWVNKFRLHSRGKGKTNFDFTVEGKGRLNPSRDKK